MAQDLSNELHQSILEKVDQLFTHTQAEAEATVQAADAARSAVKTEDADPLRKKKAKTEVLQTSFEVPCEAQKGESVADESVSCKEAQPALERKEEQVGPENPFLPPPAFSFQIPFVWSEQALLTDEHIQPLEGYKGDERQRKLQTHFDFVSFLKTVPHRPGSYRMFNAKGEVIYVGKAADLVKRLTSYFTGQRSSKVQHLITDTAHIEYTVTFSETEALLLENELIKRYQPQYNVCLRDDRNYPYLLLTTEDKHPGLYIHKGQKYKKGEYFGPFPDGTAIRASLQLLQTLFPLRQCEDSVYAHRSRPCLLGYLGRCLAPCMPMNEQQQKYYDEQVEMTRLFLSGKSQNVLQEMSKRMEAHVRNLEFEQAALLRDQIAALQRMQESSAVVSNIEHPVDVISCAFKEGICCVHILFIRQGRVYGTHSFFPEVAEEQSIPLMLQAFLSQYYLNVHHEEIIPDEIVAKDLSPEFCKLLNEGMKTKFKHSFTFSLHSRGARARFLSLAESNAQVAVNAQVLSSLSAHKRILALEELLNLKDIKRLECYDISHTLGKNTVASCVVFGRDGPDTSRYRRYNIEGITPGDDCAAMRQVLTRRFTHGGEDTEFPDLLVVDGGLSQLRQAEEIFTDLRLQKMPQLVAVAKGENRKEGLEKLILGFTHETLPVDGLNPAYFLILHMRDESHRFAITGHRSQINKAKTTSSLESIPGVGPKRRKALLLHFGGRRQLQRAGLEELAKVPGISLSLAKVIYSALH